MNYVAVVKRIRRKSCMSVLMPQKYAGMKTRNVIAVMSAVEIVATIYELHHLPSRRAQVHPVVSHNRRPYCQHAGQP